MTEAAGRRGVSGTLQRRFQQEYGANALHNTHTHTVLNDAGRPVDGRETSAPAAPHQRVASDVGA